MTSSNRRQFSRIAFHAPARLVTGRGQHDVVVLDLSLRGALIRQPPAQHDLRIGDNCSLRIRLGDLDTTIRMQGAITHIEGSRIGFACHDIDLDSVTHLRRLVELNLGEPSLLERELGALIGEE
jgi:hypothetical protein